MVSQGQTILTLGAIALFMFTALQVNRNYLYAIKGTVDHQTSLDAINFGLSVTERLYSTDFYDVPAEHGVYNDVTDPDRRLRHESRMGEELFATVEIEEKELVYGVEGLLATITVHSFRDGEYHFESRNMAALAPF